MTLALLAVTSKLTWYVARSGGLVAWATCTASIIWGLMLSTRVVRGRGIPAWLLDLHRFLGALALVFTIVHVAGLYFDHYQPFSFQDILVPMSTTWRPGAVAWGIVGFYLLLAIQITSYLRKHMSKHIWHSIHLSSFLLLAVATVHGVQAGADAGNQLVQWLAFVGVTIVAFLALLRILALKTDAESTTSSASARVAAAKAAAARSKVAAVPDEELQETGAAAAMP
jgi:hypothetical protein